MVQETHLELARRIGDYLNRRPMAYRVWVRRTALETLARLRRDHTAARRDVRREEVASHPSSVLMARELVDRLPSPVQAVIRDEQIERVRRCLAKLSEAEQEILLMRTVEGLSNQEVAQTLGVSEAAASKRYGRALLSLGQELERLGKE